MNNLAVRGEQIERESANVQRISPRSRHVMNPYEALASNELRKSFSSGKNNAFLERISTMPVSSKIKFPRSEPELRIRQSLLCPKRSDWIQDECSNFSDIQHRSRNA